jgi:hypothetical protein
MSSFSAPYGVSVKIFSPTNDLLGIISDTDETGAILDFEVTDLEFGGVDTFTFKVQKDLDIPITENAECYFYVEGTLWFIGYVIDVPQKDQEELFLEIKGNGFHHRLKDKVINVTYTGQTLLAIVQNVGSTYLGADVNVFYDAGKLTLPSISGIDIQFKDKSLFEVFNTLAQIANYDWDNDKYRWYVDNDKELVYDNVSDTIDKNYFEGYDYQAPEVVQESSEIINKILAYRTQSATPKATEYVATYQNTESQGKYGIREKKIVFPDYADSTTISNMSQDILDRNADPQLKITLDNLIVDTPLEYRRFAISNKRNPVHWFLAAECDTLTGWDIGGISVTTFSVSTDRVLTGRRALKFVTAAGSSGEFVVYTLPNILYFPILVRVYIYWDTTAIPVTFVTIDKADAEVDWSLEQITDEWAILTFRIGSDVQIRDLYVNYDAVTTGQLKVNYDASTIGFLQTLSDVLGGITSLKKVKIRIDSNTATTFYIDRIEVSANLYKYEELLLKQVRYNLTSLGLFAEAAFGERVDSIIDEIDSKVDAGNVALSIFAKQ